MVALNILNKARIARTEITFYPEKDAKVKSWAARKRLRLRWEPALARLPVKERDAAP